MTGDVPPESRAGRAVCLRTNRRSMHDTDDLDLYANPGLGFEIRKPSHWVYLATPWAVNLRRRTALSNEELRLVMEQASAPFVYAHLPHSETDSPFPTVQASCRVARTPIEPETLLHQVVRQLERQLPEFELLERVPGAIVGGCRAIQVGARFTIRNSEGAEFRCLTRSYTIFARQLVFSVGLSCAAQGPYRVEGDLDAIVRSIRVRKMR